MRVVDAGRNRLRWLATGWLIVTGVFVARLAYLQLYRHAEYQEAATDTRTISQPLFARRGEIFSRDARAGQEALSPLALNRDRFTVISDNRRLTSPEKILQLLVETEVITPSSTASTSEKFTDKSRGYVPLAKDVKPAAIDSLQAALKAERLEGISVERQAARFYPEGSLTAHLTGFIGSDEAGKLVGRYGIEGFFEERLHGQDGFVQSEKDPSGARIPLADQNYTPAKNGDDVVLTIDRAIQYQLCAALAKGVKEYGAQSATGIIMEPDTGYILALCNVPTFDPNNYQQVSDPQVYHNAAVFTAYEPGSVFKMVTMSAGLDSGQVTPATTYVDTGSLRRDTFTIRNAGDKSYGKQTMAGVIKESINTGTVFVAELLGRTRFKYYVEKFGFGRKTGVELKTESVGNIKSLDKPGAAYLATASYGQGLTVTPIQLIQAYATLANRGQFVTPTVIYAWRPGGGEWQRATSTPGLTIMSTTAANQMIDMLRAVVTEGHGKSAQVPGYVLGGKTGTADIARGGKYNGDTNHTFVGFGPLDAPRFVMLIKYESPARKYAESTAVPTFGEVAKFLLEYLGVPPH